MKMILGRVVGSSHRARKGLGVGSLPNPSLEIKEKAGGWCWVASRLSPGDWGLGEGLTKASTLTDLGWVAVSKSCLTLWLRMARPEPFRLST